MFFVICQSKLSNFRSNTGLFTLSKGLKDRLRVFVNNVSGSSETVEQSRQWAKKAGNGFCMELEYES